MNGPAGTDHNPCWTLQQVCDILNGVGEGVMITRADGRIIAVNRAFSSITGYTESDVIEKDPRSFGSGHSEDDYQAIMEVLVRDGCWTGEILNWRKNGECLLDQVTITAVTGQDGRIINFVVTLTDIREQMQHEQRLEQLALFDSLTGLPNRRLLLDRLHHAIAATHRNKNHGALFIIDLDAFKDLNDTRGHDIGDLLLKQVAKRLAACVRDADTVGRFGGDEFAVILEDLSENNLDANCQAERVGEHLLSSLNLPYLLHDFIYHCTPSIGVTLFNGLPTSIEELLKQADLAMYQAKGAGRNSQRFFNQQMQDVLAARVAMAAELRQGMKGNQMVLHYQPQTDLHRRVIGAEALVRWVHPERGIVCPDQFIPLAEGSELILALGAWVLTVACQQLRVWGTRPETAHLTMAINVSPRQFRQKHFVAQVLAAIDESGADPGKLKLEITESLLLDDLDATISKMLELKASGISFSLDDFGTGYSSLTYLKRLPIDQIKIDQSFIRDIFSDPNNATIASAIVTLAHGLGLAVIAEGVETEQQRQFLQESGCHVYQGFLFSPPLEAEEFGRHVLARGEGSPPEAASPKKPLAFGVES